MRGRPFSRPAAIASASWSMLPTLAASHSSATVFGPMPGSFSSSSTPAPYFASSSSRCGSLPVAAIAWSLRRHALADPVDLEQPRGVLRRFHQVHGRLFGSLSRAAVASDAEAICAVDLHQVGRLRQQAGHRFVVHFAALPSDLSAVWPSYARSPLLRVSTTPAASRSSQRTSSVIGAHGFSQALAANNA